MLMSVGSLLCNPYSFGMYVVLCIIWYFYASQHKNYWKDRRVQSQPYRFPFGFCGVEFLWKSWIDISNDIYRQTKEAGGILYWYDRNGPAVSISDPAVIKSVLVEEFNSFEDRTPQSAQPKIEIFAKMLHNLHGEQWKDLKAITALSFSTENVRLMSPPCEQKAEILADQILRETAGEEIEMQEMMKRYTADNIATIAFGQDANYMRNKNSVVAYLAERLAHRPPLLKAIAATLVSFLPESIRKRFDPEAGLTHNMSVVYFLKRLKERIEKRRETRREDFIQSLLDARGNANVALTDADIIAQCLLLHMAGYTPSAHTLSWACRLLAFHPHVQHRLQEEVDAHSEPQQPARFDTVANMPYLDSVVSETLRLYPSLLLRRVCTRPCTLPGTGVQLRPGTAVYILTHSMHRDPDLYPDPETFEPERWLTEHASARDACSYLPFGRGPRSCLGAPFALLHVKLALVALVRHYNLSPGLKSARQQPTLAVCGTVVTERGGTWLKLERRNNN